MALIVVPIAVASLLLADKAYRAEIHEIEDVRRRIAFDYSVRARIWLRGQAQLLAYAERFHDAIPDANCSALLDRVRSLNQAVVALHLQTAGAASCFATADSTASASVQEADALAIAKAQQNLPTDKKLQADALHARYDAVLVGAEAYLVLTVGDGSSADSPWSLMAIVNPKAMDSAFDLKAEGPVYEVQLVKSQTLGQGAPGQGAAPRNITGELSAAGVEFYAVRRWGGGKSSPLHAHSYAVACVSEPDLYALVEFDDEPKRMAWVQLLVLCATPLLILALLFIGYARSIQTDVVRWISGLEKAARARTVRSDSTILAPVGAGMPQELRSVANAFNAMAQEENRREEALRASLSANQHLMLELHHRVKNSLQVVQSYMALSLREDIDGDKGRVGEMVARVHVLSTAYRMGLTAAGMQPINLAAFTNEILTALSTMLNANQSISSDLQWDGAVVVDRAIPLGLAVVEAVIAALRDKGVNLISVVCVGFGGERHTLVVAIDKPVFNVAPSTKIMEGLAAQLGAKIEPAQTGELMRWSFFP